MISGDEGDGAPQAQSDPRDDLPDGFVVIHAMLPSLRFGPRRVPADVADEEGQVRRIGGDAFQDASQSVLVVVNVADDRDLYHGGVILMGID